MILLRLSGGFALPCEHVIMVCDARVSASLLSSCLLNSFSLLFLFLSKFLLPKDDSKMSSGWGKNSYEGVQFL